MSYIPAITLIWVGPNWSRTLFIPIVATNTMFSNGNLVPKDDEYAEDRFKTLSQLVNFFESDAPDPKNVLDEAFDEIGKMPSCVEEYLEFDLGEPILANIPPGLAIVSWHYRGSN